MSDDGGTRELLDKLKAKLAEPPLQVRAHMWRNVVGAAGAVLSASVPYALLQTPYFGWMVSFNEQPHAMYAATFLRGVDSLFAALPDWPFAELRILGWLALPGAFIWYAIGRDRALDGKLESTRQRELEHLEHEAHAAEGAICKFNQPLEETQRLARTLRMLEPKRRLVNRVFLVHKHDLGWACSWPWMIAAFVLTCVWAVVGFYLFPDGKVSVEQLRLIGAPIFGGLFVYWTAARRFMRGRGMQMPWNFVDIIRSTLRTTGESTI